MVSVLAGESEMVFILDSCKGWKECRVAFDTLTDDNTFFPGSTVNFARVCKLLCRAHLAVAGNFCWKCRITRADKVGQLGSAQVADVHFVGLL